MKPIQFKEQNVRMSGNGMTNPDGSPVLDLFAYAGENQVICCWGMSFLERIKILFLGKVWVSVLGKSTPPLALLAESPFVTSDHIEVVDDDPLADGLPAEGRGRR